LSFNAPSLALSFVAALVAAGAAALGAAVATAAAFTTAATLPKLDAGAGTVLARSAARAASVTLTSRVLLQATPANENLIANIAAPSALTATHRVFSEPLIC